MGVSFARRRAISPNCSSGTGRRPARALLAGVGLGLAVTAGAAAQPAAPEILRGSVAPPPPAVEPAAGPAEHRVTAGERLWLVDEKARTLTGCRLINTLRVGVQAIDCTTRRVPEAFGRGR